MNHQRGRAHNIDKPTKPTKPSKSNKKQKGGLPPDVSGLPGVVVGGVDPQVRVLPLTVDMVAYSYMTGEVGCRGRKKKEIRLPSEWIRSRLEGKTYDAYLLYGGVGHNERRASWTIFESLGHRLVGKNGEECIVENYGSDHGFKCSITGVRWEISLGKIMCRHYLPHENTPAPRCNYLDAHAAQTLLNQMKPMFEGFMAGMRTKKEAGEPEAPTTCVGGAGDGAITAKDMLELHKHERTEDRKHMVDLVKAFSPQRALPFSPQRAHPAPATEIPSGEARVQFEAFQQFQQFQEMLRGPAP